MEVMCTEKREKTSGKGKAHTSLSRLLEPKPKSTIHPSVADDMAGHGKPSPKPPGAPAPPPPPPPPPSVAEAKKGFMRRMFPFLLAVNLFVGAYVVVRTYYKDSPSSKGGALTDPASTADNKPAPEPAAAAPRKEFPPIPEEEQRRVYRWMLEEKRKVRPRDKAEKKRLDDEKALLKEIIRAESLPKLL
ncbi:hypothetical protein ACQ4PT_015228 [Festuca glaucescens]